MIKSILSDIVSLICFVSACVVADHYGAGDFVTLLLCVTGTLLGIGISIAVCKIAGEWGNKSPVTAHRKPTKCT